MGLPPKLEGLPDDTIRLADLREMLEDVEFERAEPEPTVRRGLKSPSVRNGNAPEPATSMAPYRLYNIGNNQPVELNYFIQVLETRLGETVEKIMLPLQPGDVVAT